jgi:hypothetical protein
MSRQTGVAVRGHFTIGFLQAPEWRHVFINGINPKHNSAKGSRYSGCARSHGKRRLVL